MSSDFDDEEAAQLQKEVEARIVALADELAPRHGLDRRGFRARSAGMAAAFLAMNQVYGEVFAVEAAEAQEPGVAQRRADTLAGQFILDPHTRYIRDDAGPESILARFADLRTASSPNLPGLKKTDG